VLLTATSDARDEDEYKPRTNLGFTMRVSDKVQLYNGYIRLIYNLHLPDFIFHSEEALKGEMDTLRSTNHLTGESNKKYVAKIAIKLHKMKRNIVMVLQERKSEIKEILFEINAENRRRRGLGSWIGGGLSHVFGLATTENLDDIKIS